MHYPKLTQPRLCRLLTYVVVIGCGLLPVLIVLPLPIHEGIKIFVLFGSLIGLLIYLIKNFVLLMGMDMLLALLSCHQTARTQYTLPPSRTADAIRNSILRYGIDCAPAPITPQPAALRYRFSTPMTVYSSGIEKIIAAYEVEYLDREAYQTIFSSAKQNSRALTGKKKPLFLDPQQKQQPLHRVTVLLILAHRVKEAMLPTLFKLVCNQCGDEDENCILPCIVDLQHRTCVFNSLRVPYIGYGYAVKNRGIRIIKKCVFGGDFHLAGNENFLDPIKDADPNESLWQFWRRLQRDCRDDTQAHKKHFGKMTDREIRVFGGLLHLRWDDRLVCQRLELDQENKLVRIRRLRQWVYPKPHIISKQMIRTLEAYIAEYYHARGYAVEFTDSKPD